MAALKADMILVLPTVCNDCTHCRAAAKFCGVHGTSPSLQQEVWLEHCTNVKKWWTVFNCSCTGKHQNTLQALNLLVQTQLVCIFLNVINFYDFFVVQREKNQFTVQPYLVSTFGLTVDRRQNEQSSNDYIIYVKNITDTNL